jgi:hypothetical protein
MEQTGNGVISQTDLMKRLVQAKKVMTKVESGKVKPNHLKEQMSRYIDNEDIDLDQITVYDETEQLSENMNISQPSLNVEKINSSKLPDAIKKAMIEHPIVQPISLSDGIDMKIIKGAKRLMEQDNHLTKIPIREHSQKQQVESQVSTNDLIKTLVPIIENMIRKVMDEKLTQLLTAQKTQSINENLVLKVGDSIFKGKITGVESTKSKK